VPVDAPLVAVNVVVATLHWTAVAESVREQAQTAPLKTVAVPVPDESVIVPRDKVDPAFMELVTFSADTTSN